MPRHILNGVARHPISENPPFVTGELTRRDQKYHRRGQVDRQQATDDQGSQRPDSHASAQPLS